MKKLFFLLLCAILTTSSFVSCSKSDDAEDILGGPESGNENHGDNSDMLVLSLSDVIGKWRIVSVDGVDWKSLGYVEEDAAFRLESYDSFNSFANRGGAHHLIPSDLNARFTMDNNVIKVYSNGELVAEMTFKELKDDIATVELKNSQSIKMLTLEKLHGTIITDYKLEFISLNNVPNQSYELSVKPKEQQGGDVTGTTLIQSFVFNTSYNSSSTTVLQISTPLHGQLILSTKNPWTLGFCETGLCDLEPGEYEIGIPYYISRDQIAYIQGTLRVTEISSYEVFDDDYQSIEITEPYTTFQVQVLITASASDIEGCTFKKYLDGRLCTTYDPSSWLITHAATLTIETYIGSRLIGSVNTNIEASDGFYTQVCFYDKNSKIQTSGSAFVYGES